MIRSVTFPFPPGLSMLSARMPIADIMSTHAKVFLPVDEIDHLGRTWQRFRLIENSHLQRKDGVETVTIEFVEDIPDKVYEPDELVEVLLGAFEA